MRITIELDDSLIATAKKLTGLTEPAALVQKALSDLVSHEASKKLAKLGGTAPDMPSIPRRRNS